MKRSLWAIPLCILGASAILLSAGAQRGGKGGVPGGTGPMPGVPAGPAQPGNPVQIDGPFTLGSRTWPSRAAWIAGGGYCATETPSDQVVYAIEADLAASKPNVRTARRGGRTGLRAAVKMINVYFHVIVDSQGKGNVTDAELQATIDHMNAAYAGLQPRTPGFKISAQDTANVPFRFRIAGIERVTNDNWYQIGDEIGMKSALRVGGVADLNVYTVDLTSTGGVLGWATFPFWYVGAEFYDGIVVDTETMTGRSYTGYNSGDVMVHEAGHWVGLFHTFQGSCFRPGDAVTDTPAEAIPYFWSPNMTGYPDSCTILAKQLPSTASPGRDPIENFMDYSAEDTKYQFTPGQSIRAEKLMALYRGL